jgi:hypothetical protein
MRHTTKAVGGYTVIVETVVNDGWHWVRREIVAPAGRQGLVDDELLIGPFPTESEAAVAGLEHCKSWGRQ